MKSFPSDAVIICAANRGEENTPAMDAKVPVMCRDCGQALMADTHTIARAEALPEREGRPIDFLCIGCLGSYSRQKVTMHDDRGHKEREAA